MNKALILAAAAAMACGASARDGQLHLVVNGESTMFKNSELVKITYQGNETDGFTHMTVETTSGEPVNVPLETLSGCEIRGAGLPDTDLKIAANTSEAMRLLTEHAWTPLGIGYDYGEGYEYWLPESCPDDRLTFTEANKVSIDLGADNTVYDDDNGNTSYDFTGEESFLLGTDAEGGLHIQFAYGGFPVIRPNSPGLDLMWVVRELSASKLELAWPYGDGGYFVLGFKNADFNPASILAGRTWKLAEAHYPADPWTLSIEDMPASADERITFNADGSLTILTDGTVYNNDEAEPFAVTIDGDETWSIVKDDSGKDCVKFGGGGFPLMFAQSDHIDATFAIEELSEDLCKLSIDYWGAPIHISLVPAE